MSAKEYSLRIEALLRKIAPSAYGKSDEILLNPYGEIISAVSFRVQQNKLEKFKLYYQGIDGKEMKELIDSDYDIEILIQDLKNLIAN